MLDAVYDAIAEVDARVARDPAAAARMLAPEIGLPEAVVELATRRQTFAVQRMDATLVGDQQKIADTFFELGLIPRSIRISDALLGA